MNPPIIVQVFDSKGINSKWYCSFYDEEYEEYIIEFSYPFSSHKEAKEALETNLVYQDMPCRYEGK